MDTFEKVKRLEVELHRPKVRSDAERINPLQVNKLMQLCNQIGIKV